MCTVRPTSSSRWQRGHQSLRDPQSLACSGELQLLDPQRLKHREPEACREIATVQTVVEHTRFDSDSVGLKPTCQLLVGQTFVLAQLAHERTEPSLVLVGTGHERASLSSNLMYALYRPKIRSPEIHRF